MTSAISTTGPAGSSGSRSRTRGSDGLAREIRIAVAAAGGGHATLMRASPALRSAVAPFEPQPEPLAALTQRLKAQFDPNGILNPGRMSAGGAAGR